MVRGSFESKLEVIERERRDIIATAVSPHLSSVSTKYASCYVSDLIKTTLKVSRVVLLLLGVSLSSL